MTPIRVLRGYDLPVKGKPSLELDELSGIKKVALLPEKIPFVKPALAVKEKDRVQIGSVLFVDKRNRDLKFLSPGSGVIEAVNYGKRRVIREIVIRLDEKEDTISFEPLSEKDLAQLKPEDVKTRLLDGGMWPFVKSLPFRDVADPAENPPGAVVSMASLEPFGPDPAIWLSGHENDFALGLEILKKLVPKTVICAPSALKNPPGATTHTYLGPYPADDPGVLHFHIKQSTRENRFWYVQGQDLVLWGQFFSSGRFPVERIMVLAGDRAENPRHFRTRMGIPLKTMAGKKTMEKKESIRFVAGGLFTGYTADPESYMGMHQTGLTLLPASDQKEFMAFARPGPDKPSRSRTFLSAFGNKLFPMDANLHGEKRACVNCGNCAKVCPVEILPQFTHKCISAGELEEALAHGLLDCVECGLCSYVCPSKVELTAGFADARKAYHKELNQ